MWKVVKNNKQTKWFETREQVTNYIHKQLNDTTFNVDTGHCYWNEKDDIFNVEYISNNKLCYIEDIYSFINLEKASISTIVKHLKNTYTYDELAKNIVKYLVDNKLENQKLKERNNKDETKLIFTLLNGMTVYDIRVHSENELGVVYYPHNNDRKVSYELVLNTNTIKNKQKIDIRIYSGTEFGEHWIQTTLDYKLDYFIIPILQKLIENIKEISFYKYLDFFNKVLDILKGIR